MSRRIVLASRSAARRKLLMQTGLKFAAASSSAEEKTGTPGNCARLVRENALCKARDVALRYDSGVVIGADTVVRAGKKIIGKPRDKKDAFRTLKIITRKPQWVYTGLAVIDLDNRKEYTGYEKTKVYMLPLTDRQIERYINKFSPLDKAGSFDIQGAGGVFIDRIEGCYYNVVGLPLALLAKMLRKTGIDIF